MTLRFVLADPQPFFRCALASALGGDGFELLASTGDEEEAASLAVEGRADLIVSEIELDRGTGLHLATRMGGDVPVLILTRHTEGDVILDAAASGAVGCVGHVVGLERLKTLLRRVHNGGFCLDDHRLQQILIDAGRATSGDGAGGIQSLTVREREILVRVAGGADDESISRSLYISPHTVRTHMGNVLRKLGVHSRAEAAGVALSSGLDLASRTEALRIEGPGWDGRGPR
jgi:DNA-binding NarL/FixJ family response regulator